MIQKITVIILFIFIYILVNYNYKIKYIYFILFPTKLIINANKQPTKKQMLENLQNEDIDIKLNNDLTENINEFMSSDGTNMYYIYKKIDNILFNKYINFIYKIKHIHPTIILPCKYIYTNKLIINSNHIHGKYFVIHYKINSKYINPDILIYNKKYKINIVSITKQLKQYCKQTNNLIVVYYYKYNIKNNKVLIQDFGINITNCNSYLYSIINMLLLLSEQNPNIIKKDIILLCSEIQHEINTIKNTYLIKDKINEIKEYIYNHKIDTSQFKNINKTETIKLTGIDISDDIEKSISDNKNNKNIQVLPESYLKSNKIGSGLFSNVYKNGDKVLKIIKQDMIIDSIQLKKVQDEINIAKQISTIPNYNLYFSKYYKTVLVKVYNEITVAIIYEYIEGYTLAELIHKKTIEIDFTKLLTEIITVNTFLNKNGINRSDNNNNNIIFSSSNNIKLIDYGFTKIEQNIIPNKQLETKFYFKLLLELALFIVLTTNDKILLSDIIKEYIISMNNVIK